MYSIGESEKITDIGLGPTLLIPNWKKAIEFRE